MDILNYYDDNVGYKIPDRTKCYTCGHVFKEHELRWASPLMPTLCDKCHSKLLSGKRKEVK